MQVNNELWEEAKMALTRSIAVYELLHAHAADQTDLTEDQLANVVTEVAAGARETLGRMAGADGG